MKDIKRIDRKLIHKGRVISLYEDIIDLGDGQKAVWDFIHHQGAAALIPIDKDGRIILVRQWRSPVDRMTWEIPAGKIDPGEEFLEGAKRELEEETGYRAGQVDHLMKLVPTIAYDDEVIEIYVATELTFVGAHPDDDEDIAVKAFTPDELRAMVAAGEICDGKTIAAFFTYADKYLR